MSTITRCSASTVTNRVILSPGLARLALACDVNDSGTDVVGDCRRVNHRERKKLREKNVQMLACSLRTVARGWVAAAGVTAT